jgi:hypothetical protein
MEASFIVAAGCSKIPAEYVIVSSRNAAKKSFPRS